MAKRVDFRSFFLSLTKEERQLLASDAGTTVGYIKTHLIAPAGRRKIPRPELLEQLSEACAAREPRLKKADLLAYFYGQDQVA